MGNRTQNINRNLIVSTISQLVSYIASFGYRTIFIHYLGLEYLGINGLFTNILLFLSLAELGVGVTITFNLYKPLAEEDHIQIRMLMDYFSGVYKKVAVIITLTGVVISPFLDVFIKGGTEIEELTLIYFLFLGNTVVTYLFSYRRVLYNADQKRYVNEIYDRIFMIMRVAIQSIVLVLTGNYILTLVIQLAAMILTNLMIHNKARKEYSDVFEIESVDMDSDLRQEVNKKVRAMFAHKLGTLVVFSTDNIVLSSFVGLYWVGLYSNYILVINTIEKFIQIMSQSLAASVGNLIVSEDLEKSKVIFSRLSMLYFALYSFSAVSLYVLLNPLILVWLGDRFIINRGILFVVVFNFFLNGMRKNVLNYRNALGLYWNDRYKALAEAAINLIVSIILVRSIGAIGVVIGTAISTLTTSIWIEPFILFRHFFKTDVRVYYIKLAIQSLFTLSIGYALDIGIRMLNLDGWLGLIMSGVVVLVIYQTVFFAVYGRSKEYRYVVSKAFGLLRRQEMKSIR